jgi:hypothetical protein
MRDRCGLAEAVSSGLVTRVSEAGAFLNRQCVHIGAQQNDRTLTIAQQSDDTRDANTLRYVVSLFAQPRSGNPCRSALLHRKFRIGMQVSVDDLEFAEEIVTWAG